jgi:membrane protein
MPERRPLWEILAYAALAVIAVAGQPVPTRGARRIPTHRVFSSVGPPTLGDEEIRNASKHEEGRHAKAPWQIPWARWKDIFSRTYQYINDNRLLAVAAGVVFYSLLALFPAISALVSLYGLVADASTIDSNLSLVSGILPSGAMDILHEELTRLTASTGSGLTFQFVFSLLFALWSAMAGIKAIIDALNVAYGEKEKRSFIRLNLLALVFTLGAIVSVMLALGAVVVVPIVLNHLGLGGVASTLIGILRWPILLVLVIAGLEVLYRYAPSRTKPSWRWISVGSMAAAVAWLVTSALFSWYIANFGSYNVTYGSLGAAIGMMMWMWISMIVVLVGAQLNAEIEQTAPAQRLSATSR